MIVMWLTFLVCLSVLIYIIVQSKKRTCELYGKFPIVHYINLKHRLDRRKHIEGELKKVNYPESYIHRFEAVRKKNGALGCGLSHIQVLQQLDQKLKGKHDYGLVLEDDFTWTQSPEKTIEMLTQISNLNKKDWNMILLACNGYGKPVEPKHKILLPVGDCQTTTGYIIKKGYIPTLLQNFKECVQQSTNIDEHKSIYIPINHIDQYWKRLQYDKWFVTNPIMGTQASSYSDIMSNNY